MTKSALRAKFERLGPTRDIDRVSSGSPEILSLALGPRLDAVKAIGAALALRKRHVPTLKAKRAVEAAIARKPAVLRAPMVEDLNSLAAELRDCGFLISALPETSVDVRRLRERLGLTQEQFALRYGLDIDAVRNWERGRREPDRAAKSYLRVIDRNPDAVHDALTAPVP